MTHLWEVDHAYYCNDGNFYANGCHVMHETWPEFMAAEGDADQDYNLVFRWDWREGEGWDLGAYNGDDYYRHARLHLYIMNQRKGAFRSAEVKVCRADEPAILAYLAPRWEHLARMWAPIASVIEAATAGETEGLDPKGESAVPQGDAHLGTAGEGEAEG